MSSILDSLSGVLTTVEPSLTDLFWTCGKRIEAGRGLHVVVVVVIMLVVDSQTTNGV